MSKESLSHADFPDKSCNSSSFSLLDQTEVSCSGSDVSDESTACTTNSYCLLSEINLQMETEMSSRSYILEDDPKQHQEEVGINLPEQVYVAGSEISIVQPDDLGSSNTFEQTKVADCSKESQNMVVRDPDGNAECNCYQDENVKCNCRLWDWGAIWDSFYSRYYFYNEKTHESTWYPPPGMENFDFGDMSCISSESNAGLTGIDPDPDPATPRCEEEKVDGYELIERIGSDEPRADPMQVSLENTADDLSSAVFPDKICEVNASAIRAVDGNPQNEISSTTPSHTGDHTCFEDIEMTANDLSMQDGPPFVKQKKRKNRRSKTSHDNKNHELQPAEESVVDITKYWCQRYRLFSRFDHGVKMDEEGWFSVTPEAIARHQASRFGGGIIIDCFAGVGGNAIQFAKTGNHVVAFDIDPKKIEYAHHNASIYGVEDRIDFIIGDSLSLAPKMRADTVFLSPPWGGPGYVKVDSYDISMLQPYDGQFLFNAFKTMASVIIMFLPKNVNIDQLAKLALSAGCEWSLEVEKNYLNGKLKAITAYFYKTSEHKVD